MTVQTEMKSDSLVVSKICSAALAPENIEAAVRRVTDKDDRSKNLVSYVIKELDNETVADTIEEVHDEIGENLC